MDHEVIFADIESAYEFLKLFGEVAVETKRDIEADLQREVGSNFSRRLEALEIIAYLLESLEAELKKSRRILNDLRSLRRLLLGERATGTMAVLPKPMKTARAGSSASSPSHAASRSALSGSAVAHDARTCVKIRRRALSSGRGAYASNGQAADVLPWYVRPDFKTMQEKQPRQREDLYATANAAE